MNKTNGLKREVVFPYRFLEVIYDKDTGKLEFGYKVPFHSHRGDSARYFGVLGQRIRNEYVFHEQETTKLYDN